MKSRGQSFNLIETFISSAPLGSFTGEMNIATGVIDVLSFGKDEYLNLDSYKMAACRFYLCTFFSPAFSLMQYFCCRSEYPKLAGVHVQTTCGCLLLYSGFFF